MEFLIPIAFFVTVAIIVNIISEKNTERIKLKILERAISEQKIEPGLQELIESTVKRKETMVPVKWGIVLIGLGLALIISNMSSFFYDDKATLSLMFLLSGIGLITYHFIFYKKAEND